MDKHTDKTPIYFFKSFYTIAYRYTCLVLFLIIYSKNHTNNLTF